MSESFEEERFNDGEEGSDGGLWGPEGEEGEEGEEKEAIELSYKLSDGTENSVYTTDDLLGTINVSDTDTQFNICDWCQTAKSSIIPFFVVRMRASCGDGYSFVCHNCLNREYNKSIKELRGIENSMKPKPARKKGTRRATGRAEKKPTGKEQKPRRNSK